MKIIYGLSGQGFGHSARSRELLRHLIESGHQVKIFTYGQSLLLLEEYQDLIEPIPGLVLIYNGNRLSYLKTVWQNCQKISLQLQKWRELKKIFADFKPDLVITDFEPLTARLARKFKKPLISFDNQHQLIRTKIKKIEKYKKDSWVDKMIVKIMIGSADYYLITSFFKTEPKYTDTFIFAPIIRREIRELNHQPEDYILVYEGSDFEKLIPLLKKIKQKFVVVNSQKEGQEENIVYKKYSKIEWLELLAKAKAVIGTAGLSLLGECIYLKKPYLALPIEKQTEQIINAEYLKSLGYGDFAYKLDLTKLENFINNLNNYQKNLINAEACGNELLFKKIDEIIITIEKNQKTKEIENKNKIT